MTNTKMKIDVLGYKKVGEIELASWARSDGSPVRVEIYFDRAHNTAYQIDEIAGVYRAAKVGPHSVGGYGEWKELWE